MKVVTFGEIMMRFQPEGNKRFLQADKFDMCFGGGEANVAVSLAQLNIDAVFCSKLPENPFGDACVNKLRSFGVDTSYIARGGSRMGVYFVEKGASQRPSKVVYDRADSAVTTIECGDIDIDKMLSGADWLHFTGITPALGAKPLAFTEELLKAAKRKNIKVSCDLNYRNKLWTKEYANRVMTKLMKYVDVLISNEEDVKDVFGITAEGSDIISGKLSAEAYKKVAKTVIERYGVKKVAFTLRESITADENNWSGLITDGINTAVSKKYNLKIVDRIGGGDSFGAGLIYSMLKGYDDRKCVDLAAAASCWKHSVPGDFNILNEEELLRLAEGDGSGRVQR